MNGKRTRSSSIKILSKNPILPLSKRNDLRRSIIQNSKMPEDNMSLEKEGCDVVAKAVSLKNDLTVTNVGSYSTKQRVQGASIDNIPCCSNDYAFDFCSQNITNEANMNHKFYGYKRRDYSSQYCESFGLPDDPIFTNNPLSFDKVHKSSLDTNLADPCDICVVNLDYIDQPWLTADQEVITPYWDVESLFPFKIEDIRQKIEPENIDLLNNDCGTKDFLYASEDNNKDEVSTTTSLNNSSIVSTINIANKEDHHSNVDISSLKDQVMKALEEVIRKKSNMTNLDMKIQIIADLSRSPEKSPKKSSVEVRINECIETESCQSSSSSKENYFMKDTQTNKAKSNSKTISYLNFLDWKEDLQDSLEIAEDSDESVLLNKTGNFDSRAVKKEQRNYRRKRWTFPTHQRNLRSRNKTKIAIEGNQISPVINSRKTVLNFNLDKNGKKMEIPQSLVTSKFLDDFNQQLEQNETDNIDNENFQKIKQSFKATPMGKFSPSKSKNELNFTENCESHIGFKKLQKTTKLCVKHGSSNINGDNIFPISVSSNIEVYNEKQIRREKKLLHKKTINQRIPKVMEKRVTRRSLKHVDLQSSNLFETITDEKFSPICSTETKDNESFNEHNSSYENKISGIRPSNEKLNDSDAFNEIKEDEDKHLFKRILRSSRQGLKRNENEVKPETLQKLSNNTLVVNKMTPIKQGVSTSFEEVKSDKHRCLRSQTLERNTSLVKFSGNMTTETTPSHIKSPKISFDLNTPTNTPTSTPLKGILKTMHNMETSFDSIAFQQQKVETASTFDCSDPFNDIPKLSRQDCPEEELDDKKNDGKFLKENGITSRVRVLISPLEIKDDNDENAHKKCLEIPLELAHQNKRIRNKTSIQPINEYFTHSTKESNTNNDVLKEVINHVEIKEIKNENIVYSVGDFVWAQVAKYPYWPAVICNDPITEKHYDEVLVKNKLQMMYHIRFFGDSGKRAWVNKSHLMLYCSRDDLKMIAKTLKSENKSYNVVKPYLVVGAQQTVEKWNKANEEIEMLKDKSSEEVVKYLIQCYENFVNKRREKRKLSLIDASSESESEEAEPVEKPRRKRLKLSLDQQANEHFHGFDEINISLDVKNNIEISDVTLDSKLPNFAIENSKLGERKSIRKIKHLEMPPFTPYSSFSQDCPPLNVIDSMSTDLCETTQKVTPRRSTRSLKAAAESDAQPLCLENALGEDNIKLEKDIISDLPVLTTPIKSDDSDIILEDNKAKIKEITVENGSLGNQQYDEMSEVGSKTSSDGSSSVSHMYTFEYQIELHKKNSLFNGLRNVKVCDYCMKQGDLYKCKGKCGGSFHLECASKVTQPRNEKRHRNKEKSPTKSKQRNLDHCLNSTPRSKRSDNFCKTRSQSQCEIITIKSKHLINTPNKDNFPDNFHELSIGEQIDYGMKEMMSKFEDRTIYLDLTDSSSEEGSVSHLNNKYFEIMESPASTIGNESPKNKNHTKDVMEEEKSSDDLEVSMISANSIRHITADSVILTEIDTPMDITNLKCTYCRMENDPPCYSCGLEVSKRGDSYRQKCSQYRCGRYYHPYCLKMWPQTQWSIGKWSKHQQPEDSFTCPAHICHTCFSEELGSTAACRLPGDKLARCLLCPAAFHATTFCVPAGSEILGGAQIVCPRHRTKRIQPINTIWCFICSEGGNLVCCDMCPTSVHPECQPINFTDDDKYICEDCESGRFPLYDEIVWVKLGKYRWWPAIVLFPNEVPENVRALKHQRGDFAVRFFGTNDHYWVNKSRSFLFQEGDRGGSPGETNRSKNKVYEIFGKAIEDAALAYKLKKEFKLRREAETINSLKPPPYVRINKNKPVGNVKCIELNLSNATACECDPNKLHPCGSDSNCINRLLMTECDPDICRAGIRCRNQAFQKREYPPMVPYKTQGRGWGLKTLAPIKMGQFIIEYVGELIDSEEYQRRIKKMHEKKEENYYFMTVDSDKMIDAGPKGNLSRFMNHSCNPNCVTQKWTVKGDTRVGLFAKSDIESGSELTFNYNLEVVGQEKKICKCGAANCSGYIGVKAKLGKPEKPQTDLASIAPEHRRPRKRRTATPPSIPSCFICGRKNSNITCNNKCCNKGYHLRCLKLKEMPDASKYTCSRHNCNICSNRTIRCCVKCINSFCPSHSEGNVRHDKFLGFVCRLHDPGISSTEGLVESDVKEDSKPNSKRIRSSSLGTKKNSNKREALGLVWQKSKEPILVRDSASLDHLTEDLETVQREVEVCGKNVDAFKKRSSKNSAVKQLKRRKISKRSATLSIEQREALRAKWRLQTRRYRLKKKMELLRNRENEKPQNQNIALNSISSNRVEMSESNIDTFDAVNPSNVTERSEFEGLKAMKKERAKLDANDEGAVSSTTSDEGNSDKQPNSRKNQQLEFDSASASVESDHVTSSPTKYVRESSPNSSEDELSLSTRLNRLSNARKIRKRKRFRVNKLLSTAKPSQSGT